MVDDCKCRGLYLQYLLDFFIGIKVLRIMKYRWKKKVEVLSMNLVVEQEFGCIKMSVVIGNDLNISSVCEDFCVDLLFVDILNLFLFLDDFQLYEMSFCDDIVKEICIFNFFYFVEKICGFKVVSDEILMISELVLYIDCV